MLTVLGKEKEYEFISEEGSVNLNGENIQVDIKELEKASYQIIRDHKNYQLEVVNADYAKKVFEIRVNGQLYTLSLRDRFDALLKELGMDNLAEEVNEDIKAPMPGLVLAINAAAGNSVSKGDTVLVLEAMKMENSIKASFDGVVSNILVKVGQTVDKNQIMIEFE